MSFLIAEILGLLALAALLGGVFVYWWLRRSWTDVSHEYERYERLRLEFDALQDLRSAAEARVAGLEAEATALRSQVEEEAAWRKELLAGLDTLRPAPLDPVLDGLAGLSGAVGDLREAELAPLRSQVAAVQKALPALEPADLGPLRERLDALSAELRGVDDRLETLGSGVGALGGRVGGLASGVEGSKEAALAARSDVQGLEERLQAVASALESLHNADLSAVESGLARVDAKVATLENTDVAGLERAVGDLSGKVDALPRTDLAPLEERVARLDERATELSEASLARVLQRLEALEASVAGIEPVDLGGIERAIGTLRPTDVSGVEDRLRSLTQRLEAVSSRVRDLTPVDLAPVEARITRLESAVSGLRSTDLAEARSSLRTLTGLVESLQKQLEAVEHARPQARAEEAPEVALRPRVPREGASFDLATPDEGGVSAGRRANLLSAPVHGRPDDLKRIRGVGPKLEGMLHGIGVYYFWQVAEWTPADVAHVDDLLEAFNGRIARDEWVKQAGSLAAEPGAANRPG